MMSMKGKTIFEEHCFGLNGIYWMFVKFEMTFHYSGVCPSPK